MINKTIKFLTLVQVMILSLGTLLQAGKVHNLTIESLQELEPARFEKRTNFKIDDKTFVGFDIDGTMFNQRTKFKKKYMHNLISRWNKPEYTQKKFGRTFASKSEAVDFYNQELAKDIQHMPGANSRSHLIDKKTPEILDALHANGAYSMYVTLRDGDFETVNQEGQANNISMNVQQKMNLSEQPIQIPASKESQLRRMKKSRYNHLIRSDIKMMYRDGAIYTGWRRTKGLAMKSFFKQLGLIQDYHTYDQHDPQKRKNQKLRNLIFVDNEQVNFAEIAETLRPYFDNIFLVHLDK